MERAADGKVFRDRAHIGTEYVLTPILPERDLENLDFEDVADSRARLGMSGRVTGLAA